MVIEQRDKEDRDEEERITADTRNVEDAGGTEAAGVVQGRVGGERPKMRRIKGTAADATKQGGRLESSPPEGSEGKKFRFPC